MSGKHGCKYREGVHPEARPPLDWKQETVNAPLLRKVLKRGHYGAGGRRELSQNPHQDKGRKGLLQLEHSPHGSGGKRVNVTAEDVWSQWGHGEKETKPYPNAVKVLPPLPLHMLGRQLEKEDL